VIACATTKKRSSTIAAKTIDRKGVLEKKKKKMPLGYPDDRRAPGQTDGQKNTLRGVEDIAPLLLWPERNQV
jgi:hypothetical protein